MRTEQVSTNDIIAEEDEIYIRTEKIAEPKTVEKKVKPKGKGGRPRVKDKKDQPVTTYLSIKELEELSEFIEASPYTISGFIRTATLEKMNEETGH